MAETTQQTAWTARAGHTPGPWRVSPAGTALAVYSDAGRLAKLVPGEHDESDAYLMAAAPKLLAAAQLAANSNHHPACECRGEKSAFPERFCTCHVQVARAAIAKARGTE